MTSPQGPTQTPAGWYPDPEGSGQQRYWDGSQWTQHYSGGAGAGAPGYAQTAQPGPHGRVTPAPSFWWAAPVLAVLALIGAAGRWQTGDLGGQTLERANGLDGDGWFTVILVVAAVVLLVVWRGGGQRWAAIVAGVLSLIAALVPLIYVIDPQGGASGLLVDEVEWSTGWGAYLAFLAALALAVLSFVLASKRRRTA